MGEKLSEDNVAWLLGEKRPVFLEAVFARKKGFLEAGVRREGLGRGKGKGVCPSRGRKGEKKQPPPAAEEGGAPLAGKKRKEGKEPDRQGKRGSTSFAKKKNRSLS